MSSKLVSDLHPKLMRIAEMHRHLAVKEGIDMRILRTWRSVQDQAKKYRCTRSKKAILAKAAALATAGRPDLGDVLLDVGPQSRPSWLPKGHLTLAGPGESKHHMLDWDGETKACAYDIGCFADDGSYIMDGDHPDYQRCGEFGIILGAEWLGAEDSRFKEAAHFQMPGLPGTKERLEIVVR